jgi:hypothetical protein
MMAVHKVTKNLGMRDSTMQASCRMADASPILALMLSSQI